MSREILRKDAADIAAQVDNSQFAGKRILVTGATGVIGTAFLSYFDSLSGSAHAPAAVAAVSRSGLPVALSHLKDNKRFSFVSANLRDPSFAESLPEADIIIHGAGYGQPGKFMEDRLSTIQLNTQATWLLLDKLSDGGRFLFVSTSEVYSGADSPYVEDTLGTSNTDHFRSCYIEAKRCGEAICAAARESGIAASSARLALAYGPGTRSDDQRVLNAFIRRALTEKKITLMDRGEAHRTYCYVVDAAVMMLRILTEGKLPYYNVGGTSETTIGELAVKVGELCDVPVSFPEDDEGSLSGAPQSVQVSLDRYFSEFDAIPFITLDEGLRRTVEWQKQLY